MPGITTYTAVKEAAEELKDQLVNFMVSNTGLSQPKVWSETLWDDLETKARAFDTQVKDLAVRKRMHQVNRKAAVQLLPMSQALLDTMDIYIRISRQIDAIPDLPDHPQTAPFDDSALDGISFKMLKDPATLDASVQTKLTGVGIPVDANTDYLLKDLRDLGILDELVNDGFVHAGAQKHDKIKQLLKDNDPPDALGVMRGIFMVLNSFNIAMLKSRVVWE